MDMTTGGPFLDWFSRTEAKRTQPPDEKKFRPSIYREFVKGWIVHASRNKELDFVGLS